MNKRKTAYGRLFIRKIESMKKILMKGLSKADRITNMLCVFTFTKESIYMLEGKMLIELEDFTVEDARDVVLIRGNSAYNCRVTQVISPLGDDHVKIGKSVSIEPTAYRGHRISGGAARLVRMSNPETVIGNEALRTFAFDIKDVNEAFDKAMKKHVRTA